MNHDNLFVRILGCVLLVAGIQCAFAKETVNSDDSDGPAVAESEEADEASAGEVDDATANSHNEVVKEFPEDSIRYYQDLIDDLKPVADSRRKTGGVVMITGAGLFTAGVALVMTSDYGSDTDCEHDVFGNQTCTDNGKEEDEFELRDWAAVALVTGGAVTFFTGLFIRKSGNHKLRRVQKYETELQYWKDVSERTVSWHVQPIVDPLRGRGGMELALGF